MKIRDVLNTKDFKYRTLVTITQNESVSVAIQKMAEHDRGSIPVCNDRVELVGIITERDILRKCFVGSGDYVNKKIRDVMTKQVATAILEDDLERAIATMKEKRIRHIPIVDENKVVGMISMRDLLGFQYEETKAEIRYAHFLPKKSKPW
ncbi:cyclic nucleotide-binding/CBS domain-containing protein [Chloroflexota bacterium]